MASKPKGAPKDYIVLRSTLHFDGEAYDPGEVVSLVDAEAAPLLAVGAVETKSVASTKTTESKA